MTYTRGEVWWGPAPHKSSPSYRPWLIINTDTHPYARTETIVLAMTTQTHTEAIEVPDDAWLRGGSNKQSFISPWYVTTIKHRDLDNLQGELQPNIVVTAIDELHQYVLKSD